jgi:predicted nucleic acid-binding protein
MLKALPVVHLNEVSESILLTAGRWKARHSISLADTLIASFAKRHGAVLIHKDPAYEALRDEVRLEALPYKARRR